MRFSLIVATLGRNEELKDLFHSLSLQTCQDFEVIVVDQNSDDRLHWTVQPNEYAFRIARTRLAVRQLSYARNVGLSLAIGEILAFPDDDCVYPPGLLAMVNQAFNDQSDLGVRTGPVASPDGSLGSGRWRKKSGEITIQNVWTCSASINIFIRRSMVVEMGGFDEQLGIGGPFGSCEDTDLVLRAIQSAQMGWYDTEQLAVHPDKTLTNVAIRRAFDYGAGLGYTLRKHNVPIGVWLNFMIRPIGGCLVNLLCGRFRNVQYYWGTLRGRVHGFFAYRASTQFSRTPGGN